MALLFGHWVSVLGSRLFFVAVAWFLTIEIGVSASSWALAIFQFVPTVLMMPVALALVDLVGRRRIVIAADMLRAGICFIGAVVVALVSVPAGLLLAVVVIGLFDTLYSPSIRAGITEAAGRFGRLSPQYVLLLVNSSASLLAPLVVPVATTLSASAVLAVNGITYLVSLVGCLYGGHLMDAGQKEPVQVGAALRRWRETIRGGWTEFRKVSVLGRIVPTLPMIDMAYAAMLVILPTIAMRTSGEGDSGWYYSALVLSYGLSRVLGAEVARRFIHRRHDGVLLALNCASQGALYLVAAALSSSFGILVAIAMVGLLSGASTLSVNEIVGSAVPAAARGRVFALIGFAVVVFIPFGPAISGLASGISPALTLSIVGALLAVCGLLPLTSREVWQFRTPAV